MCKAPRPRDARRCICNYVFEYERSRGPSRPRGLAPALLAIAATAYTLALLWIRSQNGIAGHAEVGLLLVVTGPFAIAGAAFDWGWFFRARRARLVAAIASRTGARVLYAALGGALAGVGTGLLLG